MAFFVSKSLIALILAGGIAYLVYFLLIKKDSKEDQTDEQNNWKDF